jgi:chromosome segregation ATPase
MHFRIIDRTSELRTRVAALQKQKERLQRLAELDSSMPELRLQAKADLEKLRTEIRALNLEIIRITTRSGATS